MPHNFLTHEVKNFDNWVNGFKAGEPLRNKFGIKVHGVYRAENNPNMVTIHTEANSQENFKQFLADPELKEAMDKAGVVGQPTMSISHKVE